MKKSTVEILFQQFEVIACQEGILSGTDKRAARITFDRELSREDVEHIKKMPGVVSIGTCTHRYAPEIRKSYCVVVG